MSRHHRKRGGVPPCVDPAFAQALTGSPEQFHRDRKADHKTPALCRQVQRALSLALQGMADDLLRDIIVTEVVPAPNAGRLLVQIIAPHGTTIPDLLERLGRATPRLRAEVARAITRKRAPELAFVPVADQEVHDERA